MDYDDRTFRGGGTSVGFRLDFRMGLLLSWGFFSGLAYVFWYDALKILPPRRAGVLMYLNPLSPPLWQFSDSASPFYCHGLGGA
jgi:drug/metabolite transporter (DMT)-like permease